MDPPHFLLDALTESITSGTFIDTKFYVFSHRDASGHVGSPRPLYCNSRVLKMVPYFSTLFSSGFLEGEMRDISEEFPPDSLPYTDSYDYLSDSDLEDDEPEQPYSDQGPDSGTTVNDTSKNPSQVSLDPGGVENHNMPGNGVVRMGKVAVVRDMAAVTFEAMIYFLSTGEIEFALPGSNPHSKLSPQARTGDWSAEKIPSPSAKSMYRLADKYDIPTLKEQAKAHICANLEHCDIVDEVFSSFSSFFPETLPVQVSHLIRKMKEESEGDTGGDTTKRLLDKITTLSQSQLGRVAGTLSMIWKGMAAELDLPVQESTPALPVDLFHLPNWHRVKLAILKSISTGTFIDVRFNAYNAIGGDLPLDPKPLFTSSIVIEEWGPAISTQTAEADSKAVCLADGLVDDYEGRHGELPETPHEDKMVLAYRTEARNSRQAVTLVSWAWKTWTSLLSYAYTNKINFSPLQTSPSGGALVTGGQARLCCSPRSMYSLSTALGIENIKEDARKDIQSKLTTSNIVQELFTSFAANHKEVMDVEVDFFLENFTGKEPGLLKDHALKMSSGEAPFFPTTLGLLYAKLAEKVFVQPIASGSGLKKPTDACGGGPILATEGPFDGWLRCPICETRSKLEQFYLGLYCPTGWHQLRLAHCPKCNTERSRTSDFCPNATVGIHATSLCACSLPLYYDPINS